MNNKFEEKLLNSLKANISKFDMWFKLADQRKDTFLTDLINASVYYGRCEILATILQKEFQNNKSNDLNPMFDKLITLLWGDD